MKKIFVLVILIMSLIVNSNACLAKDVWVYEYPNGNCVYMVYESVVYGVRTGFYAKFTVKYVTPSSNLIKSERLEINRDEGDWWFGIADENTSGQRVYNYEDITAMLNWLKAHESKARATGDPFAKVLSD